MAGGKKDYIMNTEKFGDPAGIMLGGHLVDISSIDNGDVLVCKAGIWVGMSVAEILGDATLLKGENGFTPIPVFRTENGVTYLKFQTGIDISNAPVYSVEVEMSSSPKILSDINVAGVSSGMYNSGDVIPAGTAMEDIIANILKKVNAPTYTSPTVSISGSSPYNVEAGSSPNITIVPTFIQNDAGAVTSFKVYKNGTVVFTGTTVQSFVDSAVLIGDTTVVYKVEVSYSQGVLKKTNLGDDYPTGRIAAGTITSSNLTYTGIRKAFYGVSSSNTSPNITSAELRTLIGTSGNAVAGTSFNIVIPGGTQKVTFGYPATLRDVSSVKYIEGMNADVKGAFTSVPDVYVYGSNSFTPILYKVYTYAPVVPFPDAVNYTVTI